MSRVKKILENGQTQCIPVSEATTLNLGFETLNPLQSRLVFEGLHYKDVNLVAAWPTSAGKTLVAELASEHALKAGQKVIYACPLKALAEEKVRRFKKLFPQKSVEVFTGDYRDIEKRRE